MNVLAVVAHPDDEVLGPGATLAKHALSGDDVLVLILGTGAMARPGADAADVTALRECARNAAQELGTTIRMSTLPDNRFDSLDLLDIVQMVESVIQEHQPEIVYTHSAADLNVDHRMTHDAVLAACRPLRQSTVRRVLAFESPSATEWGSGHFIPTVFVNVAEEPFARKGRALVHYATEMRPAPHPRSFVSVEALASWRGAMSGVDRAEAFELIREVMR